MFYMALDSSMKHTSLVHLNDATILENLKARHEVLNSILGSATRLVTAWSFHHLDRPRLMKSIPTPPTHLGCNQGNKWMGRCKMCTYLYASSRCCCESCLCNAVTQEGSFCRCICLVFPSLWRPCCVWIIANFHSGISTHAQETVEFPQTETHSIIPS